MTVWFNDPNEKRNEKYSKVGNLIDSNEVNSRLDFTEGLFRLTDENTIDCAVWAVALSDVKKGQAQGWTFAPCVIGFSLHDKAYQKQVWDKDAGKFKEETVEPTPFTKWLFGVIKESVDDATKTTQLQGFINFCEPSNSITAAMIQAGVKPDGSPLSDEMIDFLESNCFSLVDCPEIKNVTLEHLPSASTNGYKGRPAETEGQKLNARVSFVCEQIKFAFPELKLENLSDLYGILKEEDKQSPLKGEALQKASGIYAMALELI